MIVSLRLAPTRVGLVLLSVSMLALSACGSSSDKGSSSGSPGSRVAASPSTAGSSDPIALARQVVEKATQRPTKILVDTPVGKPIPAGKRVTFVSCGVEACELEVPILKEAVAQLGWTLSVLSTNGSSEQVTNAWDQIVRDKPDVALYSGTPRSQIDKQMRAAAANGTFIIASSITDPPDSVLRYVTNTPVSIASRGRTMAAQIAVAGAESGKQNAGALYVNLPDYKLLDNLRDSFRAGYGEFCKGCPVAVLDVGLANIASASDSVVSALRARPELKYVALSSDSAFVGVPAAIKAAGLDVQVFGNTASGATLQQVKSGERPATLALPAWELMYSQIDAAARLEAGVPLVPAPDDLPGVVVTKDTKISTKGFEKFPADIDKQYAALWGK
jgi:ABC-type sugar transport system substrate-binding protein